MSSCRFRMESKCKRNHGVRSNSSSEPHDQTHISHHERDSKNAKSEIKDWFPKVIFTFF